MGDYQDGDGGDTGASPFGTPSFHELLRQLGEAHDAEIARLAKGGDFSRTREDDILGEAGDHTMEDVGKVMTKVKSAKKKKKAKKNTAAEGTGDEGAETDAVNDDENEDDDQKLEPLVESNKDTSPDDQAPKTNRPVGGGGNKTVLVKQDHKQVAFGSKVKDQKGLGGDEEEEDEPKPLKYNAMQRAMYVLDAMMSQRRSQTIALVLAIFATVFFFGTIWSIVFGEDDMNVIENLLEGYWITWTYMADPGTHGDEETQAGRFIGAIIAVFGVLELCMMMAMIIDVFQAKMEALRQGKAMVVEQDHTLVFGWNEKAVLIIEEMCNANESNGGGVIVVMSHIPKPEIEKEFNLRLPVKRRLGTKVVFRTGNPMVTSELMKVAAPTARASIILSNDGDPDNSDQETLRVVLSLKTLPYALQGHIVAELRDVDNEPVVKMVGGDSVETLVCHDVLGRLMLSAARQPGLGKVYESLFGFQGDEFYCSEWPALEGETFGSLIERFPDAVPIGVFTDQDQLILNPPAYRRMKSGEKIYVIAEDDDTYQPEAPGEVEVGTIPNIPPKERKKEKILICGWRRDIRDVIQSFDSILEKGSELHMITGFIPVKRRTAVLMDEGLDVSHLGQVKLVHHFGTPSVRRKLGALPLSDYSSCMIFADQEFEQDTMKADSHSLAALLLLRDLRKEQIQVPKHSTKETEGEDDGLEAQVSSCPAICEVLDPRTQKTIGANNYVKRSADFCQTNKIAAQILAMVGENRSVKKIFDDLLGVSGNSVRLFNAGRYASNGEEVSFWTLAKRASGMQETLIGYIWRADMTVVLNPPFKDEPNVWDNYDMLAISGHEM